MKLAVWFVSPNFIVSRTKAAKNVPRNGRILTAICHLLTNNGKPAPERIYRGHAFHL